MVKCKRNKKLAGHSLEEKERVRVEFFRVVVGKKKIIGGVFL
jgi:hypothetical protein